MGKVPRAPLAQSVEHLTLNQRVARSSRAGGTRKALRDNELRRAFSFGPLRAETRCLLGA